DRPQHPDAVPYGPELAHRAWRTGAVGRVNFGNRQPKLERMHGQLGLDLETLRQAWKGLGKAPGKHPVAGQHVGEAVAEYVADDAGEELVAEAVARAVGIPGRVASRVDHVEIVVQQQIDHL